MNEQVLTQPRAEAKRVQFSKPGTWTVAAWIVAGLVALPVLSVVWLAFFPSENIWPHLMDTVLGGYIRSSLALMAGVGVMTLLLGVSTAWIVSMYEFPGRRLFEWALLLPFAVPPYVIAYVYTDLLEYAGPVQIFLRDLFGWSSAADYWFPTIRSLGGAVVMMGLVLYPYVFLLARATFLEQSPAVREVSRTLGCTSWQSFLRVSLPMARPAIAVGLSLVLMETLNDYGTVDYFAVRTLTAGIYDVWLNMSNIGGAAQIATVMMSFVIVLITLERFARRKQRQFSSPDRFSRYQRIRLKRNHAFWAWLACALPLALGFLVPSGVLLNYSIRYFDVSWTPDFVSYAFNSFSLSLVAALVATMLGLLLVYSKRLSRSRQIQAAVRLSGLGYTMPGAVLAIGVIIPLAGFDNTLDAWMRQWFGISTGLLLSGTVVALVFAYVVRFLAMATGSVESSLDKITPSMDMASRSLGFNTLETLVKVHLPLIRPGLLTAALLVFVDCMKELPATLVLRPFNFDTLATHVYQFASDELLEESALSALVIVVVGIIPVILLSRSITSSRNE